MKTAITWFELPVTDLARARAFYEKVLAVSLHEEVVAGMPMAFFPHDQGAGVGGALVKNPQLAPSPGGAVVYLDTRGALDACLARVLDAGGAVLMARTDVGAFGFIAIIGDTEGNRVGLHMARA